MLATNMEYKMKIDFTQYKKPKPYIEEEDKVEGEEKNEEEVEEEKKTDPEQPNEEAKT